MKQLLPIPPDSLAARNIARMEEILRKLRQVARDAGVADRFKAHDASRGGGGVNFSDLCTATDGQEDWKQFYHYYGIEWRDTRRNPEGKPSGDRGPQWIKFCTEDRLTWSRLLPTMLDALAGLQVTVSRDVSWRWDRVNVRPGGQPRYVPVYQAMVCLTDSNGPAYRPEGHAESMLALHCIADHPLADQHLFDWQQDVHGRQLFNNCGWNRDGFWANFASKSEMEQACETMLAGMSLVVEHLGKGKDSTWLVIVNLVKTPREIVGAAAELTH